MPPHAPSREEIARTIFVGNIPEGVGSDDAVEAIMSTAGAARFFRAVDANNKPQTFGFAEYGDAQSLRTAMEIFQDVRVPTKRQKPGQKKDDGEEVETTKLQVMVDDASVKYAEDWTKNEDEAEVQFRIDSAKESLAQVLARIFNPPEMDYAADISMHDAPQDGDNVAVLNIDITAGEDELADIPADQRETVAAEIAAFRDRSIKRDQERLKREEEIEAEQRRRDRRASPPASAPSAPGGANGIPLGPRADRGVHGAPSGPKGSQLPRDYQSGVNFVNGGTINNGVYIDDEHDDDSASDSEIEQQRKKKQDTELDEQYEKHLARWMKQENRYVSANVRSDGRKQNEEAEEQKAREKKAKSLAEFDDDVEATQKRHLYYRDHGEYMRERQRQREREEREDRLDREQEKREELWQQTQKENARNEADAFLDQHAEEMLGTQEATQQQFKISLGAAAKKLEQTAAPRRTAADVENMLEDEEPVEETQVKKRTLIPLNFDAANVRSNLTEEEIKDAQREVARSIPQNIEELWAYPVSWQHLLEKDIETEIKEWVAKKVLETLGIQDDFVVDVVIEHLRNHGGPTDLVENLEPVSIMEWTCLRYANGLQVLDEEAERFVKLLWRRIIFQAEREKRGIK